MIFAVLALTAICVLAFFIRKAVKGTPFAHKCPCTPYIEHLRSLENADAPHKKEDLW